MTTGNAPGTETPRPARDRDSTGRPRNARPRDALGRPLPRGEAGEPPLPDGFTAPPAQALALAQQLIDTGRAFRAHEVLEAAWKAAPTAEREIWQGLAQVAVGLTHAQRGNGRGAATLLRRGARRVAAFQHAPPHGIDAAGVAAAATRLAGRIEQHGLGRLAAEDLRVTLRQSLQLSVDTGAVRDAPARASEATSE
jgi:hypothetical protein